MPPDKRRDDLLRHIPEKLPLYKLGAQGQTIFPDSVLSLNFNDSEVPPAYQDVFREKPYIALGMLAPDGAIYDVAVLGKIKFLEAGNDLVDFTGLCRVHYQIVETSEEGKIIRWYPLHKLPIPPEILANPKFLTDVNELKELFAAFVVKLQEELGDEAEEFFGDKHTQNMLSAAQNISLENMNPALALDKIINNIMNFMNRVHVLKVFMVKRAIYWIPSLIVLNENNPLVRLEVTAELLKSLLQVLGHGDAKEEDLSEDNQEPQQISGATDGKALRNARQIIQEELSRPREITPRFTHSASPPPEDPSSHGQKLDWEKPSDFRKKVIGFFDQYLVNQKRAREHLAQKLVSLRTGLADPDRPIIGGILCGPTGVGKTLSVSVLARFLFDNPLGYTHVDCGLFQQKHELSDFRGAPAGYVGYDDLPLFSQWPLDKAWVLKRLKDKYKDNPKELLKILQKVHQLEQILYRPERDTVKKKVLAEMQKVSGWRPGEALSIILFDEVEKAHPDIINTLLGVLNDGLFRSRAVEDVIFRNAIFFFTSNIHGRELAEAITGRGKIGIHPSGDPQMFKKNFDDQSWKETRNTVMKFFKPEFIARIGKENIIVFHPFSEEDLLETLERVELPDFTERLRKIIKIDLWVAESAKKFIVAEAADDTNRALGARALQRVLTGRIQDPIANLLDLGEIAEGDYLLIDAVTETEGQKPKITIKKRQRSP